MAPFKYKSSGTRKDDRVNKSDERVSLTNQTIGIKTPLTNFNGDQIFDMHTDFIKQLKDNLKNLLLTNRGERLVLFNYGTNLNDLVFDYSSKEDFEQEIEKRIIESVNREIPAINITEVSIVKPTADEKFDLNKKGLAGINVRVVFDVPRARITNQGIEVRINPGG